MQIISNERIIPFDVDGTLILSPEDSYVDHIRFADPYDGSIVRRKVHRPHLKLLRNYIARGAQPIVWSKNGVEWAYAVLLALGFSGDDNIIVMTKPFVHVDDEPCDNWMGQRVFIPADNSFGQERE